MTSDQGAESAGGWRRLLHLVEWAIASTRTTDSTAVESDQLADLQSLTPTGPAGEALRLDERQARAELARAMARLFGPGPAAVQLADGTIVVKVDCCDGLAIVPPERTVGLVPSVRTETGQQPRDADGEDDDPFADDDEPMWVW